ncbi:MAG: AraC family transcriptional regulator [Lentisphaeria bacterium]|nr:AraC family transcriptional regulator [Lentisphaeria bacterium]
MTGSLQKEFYSLLFPKSGTRLHTMPVNCGHEFVDTPAYSWDGMQRGSHDLVIWQYTLAGQGALDFGSRTIPLPPGTGFLVVVPEKHRYYLPEMSPGWEFVYASFSGAEAVRIAEECRRRRGPAAFYEPDSAPVQAVWQLLDMCRTKRLTDACTASSAAYSFLMQLLSASVKEYPGNDEKLINMVHEYCLKNISRQISVGDVADFAGLSRWHFSRRFKEACGKTLHDFLTELKMRIALRRLQSSRNSVKEIAAFCGYDDPSYFCKVFKRIYGNTPAEFRDCSADKIQ